MMTTPLCVLITRAACQKTKSIWEHAIKGQGESSNDWQLLQRKEFQSKLCACKPISPSLPAPPPQHIFKDTGKEKRKKNLKPCSLLINWILVLRFSLGTYVYSRGPSPCSRLCICTCTSPACCSRWQSCCSGFDLKSTHPHLKDNGSITTFSSWVQVQKA